MPRVLPKKKTEIDPEAMYVAWDAAWISGIDYVVQAGKRLRGDHPAVQHAPWLFLPEGTPDNEIDVHRRKEYAKESEKAARSAKQTGATEPRVLEAPPPLQDEDAVVAIRGGVDPTSQRTIHPGDKLPRNHPAVKQNRDAFVDVTNGVPRERARVADVPVANQDENENVRTLYAGQWVDQDDPFVLIHPHIFKRPG